MLYNTHTHVSLQASQEQLGVNFGDLKELTEQPVNKTKYGQLPVDAPSRQNNPWARPGCTPAQSTKSPSRQKVLSTTFRRLGNVTQRLCFQKVLKS